MKFKEAFINALEGSRIKLEHQKEFSDLRHNVTHACLFMPKHKVAWWPDYGQRKSENWQVER